MLRGGYEQAGRRELVELARAALLGDGLIAVDDAFDVPPAELQDVDEDFVPDSKEQP